MLKLNPKQETITEFNQDKIADDDFFQTEFTEEVPSRIVEAESLSRNRPDPSGRFVLTKLF